jgi:hypothetical protein
MQKALERTNSHLRHIAELSNKMDMDYVRDRVRKNLEPIHFGGLKSELIKSNLIGGALSRIDNYQGETIRAFSVRSHLPKPNLNFHPDTLAVGKSIGYSETPMNIITPTQYQNDEEMADIGIVDDYEKVKDMNVKNLVGGKRKKKVNKK